MSQAKMGVLKTMLDKLVALDVIEHSQATGASQVLLVAKKNTEELRFCIDFRALNEATLSRSAWPIPNIRDMLRRLGDRRPKYFGVMDLTAGYHQACLDPASRELTAFITAFGLFQWKRVAMGLMGAPAYFQRAMMVEVLGELLTECMEVYLDDFLVFGQTINEFCGNLRKFLQRCSERKITLHPRKCKFGLEEVEYVGFTISSTGMHFVRSKLDRVLDIPRPTTKGQVKTFLGVVNYFHAHVRNLSITEHPLTRLTEGYNAHQRQHKVVWTAETEAAYLAIRQQIDECPKLFFVNGDWPICLQTDASEYGMGAYMFQINPETQEHLPIEYMSKSFSEV